MGWLRRRRRNGRRCLLEKLAKGGRAHSLGEHEGGEEGEDEEVGEEEEKKSKKERKSIWETCRGRTGPCSG